MVAATGTWNHEGRDYWPQQFAACNGKRQSPININNQDVKLETDVNDLNFPRYDLVRVEILLTKFYSFKVCKINLSKLPPTCVLG
jgi:carbonic anhydrase